MSLESSRTALRVALLSLVVLSPLPFGSVEPWAVLTLEISAAVLATWAIAILTRDPDGLATNQRRMLWPAGLLVGIGILQLLPASAAWTRLVAAPTAAARDQLARVIPDLASRVTPQSLEPPATSDALLRLTAYVLIGLAAAVAVRTRAHLRQAAIAIAASGAFQAIYGSAEYLSGRQHIFGYAKKFYADEASGTFINRNHFAGYLAMTLPLSLGLVLEGARGLPRAASWRDRLLQTGDTVRLPFLFGAFAAAVIWIGTVLSFSRGGLAVALITMGYVAFRASIERRRAWSLLLMLTIPTVLLLWQQVRAPGERFVSESENVTTIGGRLPVWKATFPIISNYSLLGTGYGTFEAAFDANRPPQITGGWDHAHTDWLESLAEGGPLLVLSFVALLVISLRVRTEYMPVGSHLRLYHSCVLSSILAIAVYSLVDFCLRIPAIAALSAAAMGTAVASLQLTDDPPTRPQAPMSVIQSRSSCARPRE